MKQFGQPTTPAARSRATEDDRLATGAARHEAAPAPLERWFDAVSRYPFAPPIWLRNQHFQTIWPNRVRRHPIGPRLAAVSDAAVIDTPDGDRLQLHWSRQGGVPDRGGRPRPVGAAAEVHPNTAEGQAAGVLIVLHGLTGGAESENVLAVAAKGYAAGFDVVRVDLRNSQGDHPALGIGHAGRSEDLKAVIEHVAERYPDAPVAVTGFSLGGNIALKALGEYGSRPPARLRAVATISVPIDLDDACHAIDHGTANWIYRSYFLKRLGSRYIKLAARHPDRFPEIDVSSIKTIRAWDNAVVARLAGFRDAEDYYAKSSAQRVLDAIRVPSLIIQAQDDPFIPFRTFSAPNVTEHRWLRLLAPRQGGHVGFYSGSVVDGEPDCFWAENRALAFCARAVGLAWPPAHPLERIDSP